MFINFIQELIYILNLKFYMKYLENNIIKNGAYLLVIFHSLNHRHNNEGNNHTFKVIKY